MGYDTLGQRIRALRELYAWKQPELARRLGIKDVTAVSRWENDHHRPSAENMRRLADAFEISIDMLEGREPISIPLAEEGQGIVLGEEGLPVTDEDDVDMDQVVHVWITETNNYFARVIEGLRSSLEQMEGFHDRTRALERRLRRRLRNHVPHPDIRELKELLHEAQGIRLARDAVDVSEAAGHQDQSRDASGKDRKAE